MDIIIMIIVTVMFLRMIIRGKVDRKDFAMWVAVCILSVILFKLHATSALQLNL
ncbi:DUF5993 family protein [Agrilactobacillus fermenti]|uniref:DUF5993 family protein n=1 Tax=Agrilactobacillus fermenti TaxID=2586909 RepID=UPI001E50C99A|nr:DUF5993 family protein [Agrilactobacillus fermenti]MCD2256922.1 hypothetical protein [Agrilactobacillus fermenti]